MLPSLALVLSLVVLPGSSNMAGRFGIGEVAAPPAIEQPTPAPPGAAVASRAALAASPSGPASYTQTYIWPLDRHLYDGLTIVNYVDHDPTTGIQDYMGGAWSYDGHTGTDNALVDFRSMDRGTQVRAAAPGTVAYMSNPSPYDRHCDFNWPDDGNWIWIAGGDGSYHEYLHLRTDSRTVQVGDVVQTGQLLGLVGSSGYSTEPHLHFEAGAYDGPAGAYQPRDPYHGPDNAPASLWNTQPDYVGAGKMWVPGAGVYTESQVGGNVGNITYCDIINPLPEPSVYGIGESRLCMRIQYQTRCCDTASVIIRRPSGVVYGQFDFTVTGATQLNWFWSWFWFAGGASPADYGTWREQIVRKDGTVLLDHPFAVGAVTQWGPRFWPRAGRSFRISGAAQRDTVRELPYGPAVTYALVGAPTGVTLTDSVLTIPATSTQPNRSAFFQVVMSDAGANRDTAFYHLVDMSKPVGVALAAPPLEIAPKLQLAAAPRPFRDDVLLSWALPASGRATLAVLDLSGRRVRTLTDGAMGPGEHAVRWDGRDDTGRDVPAGVYWARLVTPGGSLTQALVRVR